MAELLINGLDAYAEYGVRMGDDFLDALTQPVSVKGYIENESRLTHGKQVLVKDSQGNSLVRLDSREVTLVFVCMGETHAELVQNRKKFYEMLYQGELTIQVPDESPDIYKLVYKGKPSSYGMNLARTICKVAIKFEEPNPNDRE